MKRVFLKTIALSLALVLALGMLSGCGKQEEADVNVEAATMAAQVPAAVPMSVTIDADGKQITIEDASGKSIQQLLSQAKVTLNAGDVLSFDPNQVIGGSMTVSVLRVCHVTVTVAAEDPTQNVTYHVVLTGGTVADAIEAAGVKLTNKQIANHKMDAVLVGNMEILVSDAPEKAEEETKPTETEATEPEITEEETPEDESSEDDWSDDDWSDDDWSDDDWSDDDWSDDDWYDEPETTTPPATEPPATEPEPTTPSRYEVSRETYYDCDGSGHGVIVITYSDGTQEEVYF